MKVENNTSGFGSVTLRLFADYITGPCHPIICDGKTSANFLKTAEETCSKKDDNSNVNDESSVVSNESTETTVEATDRHASCDASTTSLDDVVKAFQGKAFQGIADAFAAANSYGMFDEATVAADEVIAATAKADESTEATVEAQEENLNSGFEKLLFETKSVAKLWDKLSKEWESSKDAEVPDSVSSYVYSIPSEYLQEYKGKNKSEKIANMLKTVRKDFAVLCGFYLASKKLAEDSDKLNKDKQEIMKAFSQAAKESTPNSWKKN